ncbi:MAG: hypothetical protein KZQ76_14035 [Candidatus Thiodiazotropha sp. (ex Epidulcina cf. delphinae)]|nr:hypothetical protein [Candidatus Thiodiazotropha sp. (ex Epidulcina cf. delphinae)]
MLSLADMMSSFKAIRPGRTRLHKIHRSYTLFRRQGLPITHKSEIWEQT